MAVSRAYKRGSRAHSLRPASRARRVEWNANLSDMTKVSSPEVGRIFHYGKSKGDIQGKSYNHLTAIEPAMIGHAANGATVNRWWFLCSCGTKRTFPLHRVRNGAIKDCGCIEKEQLRVERQKNVEARLQHHPGYETETALIENGVITETVEITINRSHTIFDKWLYEDEEFFARRHTRVIGHARDLWREVSGSASYYMDEGAGGQSVQGLEFHMDGLGASRARNLLRRARSLVPKWKWDMFENVIRWNEPYGFPGSRLYGDKPKREHMAKLVVRDVANAIAESLVL